jgi:hypothetical protein
MMQMTGYDENVAPLTGQGGIFKSAISGNTGYSRKMAAISVISGYYCDLAAFYRNTRYNCDFLQ